MPNWTPDQENCILARGGTVLVSAAAGSGKTAVLIARVIQRLTDTKHPCNADELLIVTFTKAATAEMRSRLSQAVAAALEQDPGNAHLQKQQLLIPSAKICTIDAFCSNLVREHFDHFGIAPDFRMLDDNEGKLLQQDAVSAVVEALYAEKQESFQKLVELLSSGKDDINLETTILKLYNYSRAYPSPEAWLKQSLQSYNTQLPLSDTPVFAALKRSVSSLLSYALDLANQALGLLLASVETASCDAVLLLQEESALISKLQKKLEQADLDGMLSDLQNYQFPKWSSGKGLTKLENVQKAKAFRDIIKDLLSNQLPKILVSDIEDWRTDTDELRPLAEMLVEAVLRFTKEYGRLKQEANALDFSDVENFTLQLLVKDPAATPMERTDLAKELGLSFREILLDEYQDTNRAQDAIFSALSKEENNLFMVGDVKQSIYRFRQAMPENFLERKERYPLYDPNKDQYPATITLGKNFRSRKGITDIVNFTFRQLMSKEVGEIDYNDEEALVFGADYYPPADFPETEFFILEKEKERKPIESEARFLAQYIRETMAKDPSLSYKDFAILLQAPKNSAPVYEQILRAAGIPVYAGATGGFLQTPDISTVLSFLRIIDNPLQDIPLCATLLSPLFGFTEDDLTRIRLENKYASLYAALLQASRKEENNNYRSFLEQLRQYRRLSVSMPCGQLIRQIYEDTSYLDIVAAKRDGKQREANLRQLLQMADSYDTRSTYGLSGFLRYLDHMEENQFDQDAPTTLSEASDVVRIMSIHKSKGLQFKICILANLDHSFNKSDLYNPLILHPTLGIGLKGRNFETGYPYPTLVHTAIQLETNRATLSETLRVLYVAMTRAKERLVMLGVPGGQSSLSSKVKKLARPLSASEKIDSYPVEQAGSFLDWLLMAFLRHPALEPARNLVDFRIPLLAPDFRLHFHYYDSGIPEESTKSEETTLPAPDPKLVAELKERIQYEYPYQALATTLTKRAASTLQDGTFNLRYFAKAQPEFLSKSGLTPAERGTCLHKFMQYADFLTAAKDPQAELERLVNEEFLTPTEAASISPSVVSRFFRSNLYARIVKSPQLLREKKFAILEDAGTFDPDLPEPLSKEKVLVQGIVDCAFEEDKKLVVVDYKTDHMSDPDRFIDLYQEQLLTYCTALSRCTGMEVKEAYLFSFALGKEIPVKS